MIILLVISALFWYLRIAGMKLPCIEVDAESPLGGVIVHEVIEMVHVQASSVRHDFTHIVPKKCFLCIRNVYGFCTIL